MATKQRPNHLHCDWRVSMAPAWKKLLRTLLFMSTMGIVTAFALAVGGDILIVVAFLIATLVVYGVDEIKIEYGKLKIQLGNEDGRDSQTPLDKQEE